VADYSVSSSENGLNERLMDPEHTISAHTLETDMMAQAKATAASAQHPIAATDTVGFTLAVQ
jgi:hypothetical protein